MYRLNNTVMSAVFISKDALKMILSGGGISHTASGKGYGCGAVLGMRGIMRDQSPVSLIECVVSDKGAILSYDSPDGLGSGTGAGRGHGSYYNSKGTVTLRNYRSCDIMKPIEMTIAECHS